VRRDAGAYERGIKDLIAEGQRTGLIRRDLDARVTAMAALGAANWVHRWYRPDHELSREEIARQIAELLVSGLVMPAARARR